ncbi:hypothetical protein QVD17_16192 [Tagetes erecta]|uniref:PB1-like domain-containing protein n=1 Tax=Tagetes erecta TaxID=13708 RepID=A0AAD8KUP8_TARER|nr:hypothetical protein QVD17_16192 [Tagetes erecta]
MARFCICEHITQKEVDEFYEYNLHLFSIKLHHGGVFTKFPDRMYVDGKATYVDLLDSERFLVHELDCVMSNLGYATDIIRYYHYLVPNRDLDFGISALGGDQDVISFAKFTSDHKIMNVYTEFETTNVHIYFCCPSKMSIKELSEDVEFSNNKKSY